MPTTLTGVGLPTHLDLPDTDGMPSNGYEPFQANLLTGSVEPIVAGLHPDKLVLYGHDMFVYWKRTDPPLNGCKAPDWYVVIGVARQLDGVTRRSYVMWQEHVPPVVALECVSGTGEEEHDQTPESGKFWVYERGICIPYYAIHDRERGSLEVYRLVQGRYRKQKANTSGRYPIEPLGVELGHWEGVYQGMHDLWVRAWSPDGKLLPTTEEREEAERARRERAEAAQKQAEADARAERKAKQEAEAAQKQAEADARAERKAKQEAEAAQKQAEAAQKQAETARQQAEAARQQAEADALAERKAKQQAEAAQKQAEANALAERKRLLEQQARSEQFAAKLRELGIDPETM